MGRQESLRLYHQNNKKKINSYQTEWQKNNRDKCRNYSLSYYEKRKNDPEFIKNRREYDKRRAHKRRLAKYGLTEFDYDFMMALCEGKCPLCNREWGWDGTKYSLGCIDHDHETNKVRGIICGYCNTAEGLLARPEAAINLASYMQHHKQGFFNEPLERAR